MGRPAVARRVERAAASSAESYGLRLELEDLGASGRVDVFELRERHVVVTAASVAQQPVDALQQRRARRAYVLAWGLRGHTAKGAWHGRIRQGDDPAILAFNL
jgi:hypothetical protein